MLATARYIIKRSLLLQVPRGALRVFDDDVFIVSYPRSGNTWVRFLISDLTCRVSHANFLSVERAIPDIYRSRELQLLLTRRPRILKSHEPFDERYRRVIYLIRDPRDVVVSYYQYQKMMDYIPASTSMQDFAEAFIEGKVAFGSWQDHVEGWTDRRYNNADMLLSRYEDLLHEPVRQVKGFAAFLRSNQDYSAIQAAIDRNTFEKIRESEARHGRRSQSLRDKKSDGLFVRTGSKDRWKGVLPAFLARAIEVKWQKTMQRFGYL